MLTNSIKAATGVTAEPGSAFGAAMPGAAFGTAGPGGAFGTEPWSLVGRYRSYADAQAAVDRLSDTGFAVRDLDIVGSDLQLVERVTGRLTKVRAAQAGAATGAWLGLLLGLAAGIFTTEHVAWLWLLGAGLLIGAAWGAVLGFAAHAATRGQRDFSSVTGITAAHYDLVARGGSATSARAILETNGLAGAHE